jgi:hypothetical protein
MPHEAGEVGMWAQADRPEGCGRSTSLVSHLPPPLFPYLLMSSRSFPSILALFQHDLVHVLTLIPSYSSVLVPKKYRIHQSCGNCYVSPCNVLLGDDFGVF